MKKAWLLSAALCAIMSSGCGLTDTPNELMRAPSADGNQQSINQAVMQYLPAGSQLTIPAHPDESSAVSMQDLNGDGEPEVVAFYKTDKTDYEIGVLVLTQKKGSWEKLTSFTGVGNELDYVSFDDLTGDHVPEMLIGFSGGDAMNKELSVSTLVQGQPKELLKQSYSTIATGDMNGDGLAELAIVLHDHNNLTSKAELYGIKDGRFGKLTETALDGGVNGYEQAVIGKASPDKNGLFIEAGLGAHSASTDLLIWDHGELRNPLAKMNGEMDLTFKPYPLYSEDINGDGIIEIGIGTQPPGTEDLSMAEIPWVSSYFQWDGKNGLKHVQDRYQNYEAGLDFTIPAKWAGKYTVERGPEPDSLTTRLLYYGDNGKEKAELLTLQVVPQREWNKFEESLKQKLVPYVLLREEGKQVLVAIQPQESPNLSWSALQEYKTMLLTPEEIRGLYRPLKTPL